jgi:hypothetical protein
VWFAPPTRARALCSGCQQRANAAETECPPRAAAGRSLCWSPLRASCASRIQADRRPCSLLSPTASLHQMLLAPPVRPNASCQYCYRGRSGQAVIRAAQLSSAQLSSAQGTVGTIRWDEIWWHRVATICAPSWRPSPQRPRYPRIRYHARRMLLASDQTLTHDRQNIGRSTLIDGWVGACLRKEHLRFILHFEGCRDSWKRCH